MSLLLSRIDVQNMSYEGLVEFLKVGLQEGAQIDYKEALSGASKNEAHREFLKDVSAFANAHGGLLIIGVKEPEDGLPIDDQILGVTDGTSLAKDLERVAATSIDPRIPGLLLKSVPVPSNTDVILVFIPPSMNRPHMVSYRKHRSFYIRHSESSVPMTTHEIRDTVLSSATSEGRALSYAESLQIEASEYLIKTEPGFLIQAIPLISLNEKWTVLEEPITGIIRGENRRNRYRYYQFDLASNVVPTPTIYGVIGRESREDNDWQTEVHRNGYIQAAYMDIQHPPNHPDHFALHDGYYDLFRAFADFCQELWNATQTDLPYLLRCMYLNAESTMFFTGGSFDRSTKPFGKHQIIWPDQIRQVGQPLENIRDEWTVQLFNAFGLNWKVPK